jgi:N,N-dimethylformamidase
MKPTSRREFIARTGLGIAGATTLSWSQLPLQASTNSPGLPPHRALDVYGVHAYPADHSIAAGDELQLHVSNTVPYRLSICRLGLRVDDPAGDEVVHEFPEAPPAAQPIHPGSYVQVEKGLPAELRAVTLECWVRPWRVDVFAGLITQYDYPNSAGLGLFLTPKGEVAFYLGEGGSYDRAQLHRTAAGLVKAGQWHHIVATWDGQEKAIWVDGAPAGAWPFEGKVQPGEAPLRLAAYGETQVASHFLDGDLAMPAIYSRALSTEEVQGRFNAKALELPDRKDLFACWRFTEEKGPRVADTSGKTRHGRIINHATWMIGGPAFQAEVPRFGDYDPKQDKTRGHGLRFSSDDLYDCRWNVAHRFRIPAGARPGIYVARFRFEFEGQPRLYDCTFIVRRPARRRKAPILVVTATNTWRAYSGTPFAITPGSLKQVWGTGGIKNAPNHPPAYNFYRGHTSGQGTYQMGLRMPWPAAGPYVLYGGPTDYSHLMRAERFTHIWLEQEGYEFDVVSDLDLHRFPDLLRGYPILMINGHNEYWSIPMYRSLQRFLAGGGNLLCLSGNSLFWRVSFNEDFSVIECRKVDAPGDQVPAIRRGEAWHSQDGRRGGMMRECGYPGYELIGLDILGWNNQGNPENFGPYVVEQPYHFLFNTPEALELDIGDKIGQAGEGQLPMANGHEIDIRPSTFAALQEQPTPEGAIMPSDPRGMLRLANGIIPWSKGGAAFDYFFRPIKPKTQGAEMIYWERPEGGKVFNSGAIGTGWTLSVDPKLRGLLRNVLAHFGVRPPGRTGKQKP